MNRHPSRNRKSFPGLCLMIVGLGFFAASHAVDVESRATSVTGMLDLTGLIFVVIGGFVWLRRRPV